MGDDLTIDTAQPVMVAVKGDPAARHGIARVELDLSKFHSGRWALQLDSAFARRSAPAVILAEGVACLAVAWWAQLSPRSYMTMIRGALFVSPLDMRFGQESIAASARLSPATALPFPSVVVDTAYPFVDRLLALADSWGSAFVEMGATADGQSTNRRGVPGAAEAQLLGFLGLVEPGTRLEPHLRDTAVEVDARLV